MYWTIIVSFGLVGAIFGSFIVAQVWRLRAKQLEHDKAYKQEYDKAEYKKLKPLLAKDIKTDRSKCLSCGHELHWYDLVPIVSWVVLGGKCRYCRQPIGLTEFITELGMAALFILSFLVWIPASGGTITDWLKLAVWLIAMVSLAINFIYDLRWYLLVSGLNWLVIVCGIIFSVIALVESTNPQATLLSIIGALAILSGLYGALWLYSKGKWVGDGDIYLGAGLALLLVDWKLAFVALFSANLVGTIFVLPQLINKNLKKGSRVPFGPLLIIGFLIAWLFGNQLINWYFNLMFL